MNKSSMKCVFVGDSGIGKTSLIVAYTTNGFCERYNPTTFDNYSVSVTVDNKPFKIEICDTAGRSEFDSIRLLSYNETNVFVLCFSVMSQDSLQSVVAKWLPEVKSAAPNVPIILVGTQCDQRHNIKRILELRKRGAKPADMKVAKKFASQQGIELVECSALTQENLKDVFDLAILNGLPPRRPSRPLPPPPTEKTSRSNHSTFKMSSFRKIVNSVARRLS